MIKTTTFQDVLYAAAEFATRTRDQLPVQEYVNTQGFIAAELLKLWTLRPWEDLMMPLLNVQAAPLANGDPGAFQFSRNVGAAGEIGFILGVWDRNPQSHHHRVRPVGYYGGTDGAGNPVIWIDGHHTNLWVEYMVPYPGTAWPDINPVVMNTAAFLAANCPLMFRNILGHKAAAHLFGAELGATFMAAQLKLGDDDLVSLIQNMGPPPPWRQRIQLRYPSRRGRVWA